MAATASRRTPLGACNVHVYSADLDTVRSDVAVLSEDELERAGRFRFERDRRRFVAGRSTLRRLLASYLDASPREIGFEYGSYGKPDVPGAELSFNVSHSGRCALFAFSPRFELGVDVELLDVRRGDDVLIAEHYFSPQEVATLVAHSPSAQPRAFLRCWTRKEAFIKARGDGLSLPLHDFDVSFATGEPPAVLRTTWSTHEPEEWTLHDISGLFPMAVAALALRAPEARVVSGGQIE